MNSPETQNTPIKSDSDLSFSRYDQFLSILAEVSSTLNLAQERNQAIQEMLPLFKGLPQLERVSVARVFEKEERWYMSQLYEWLKQGDLVRAGLEEVQNIEMETHIPTWMDKLQDNQIIMGGVTSFQGREQQFLQKRAQSLVVWPLWLDQKLWGILGFVSANQERGWTEQELKIFRTVAINLSSTLTRLRKASRLQARVR